MHHNLVDQGSHTCLLLKHHTSKVQQQLKTTRCYISFENYYSRTENGDENHLELLLPMASVEKKKINRFFLLQEFASYGSFYPCSAK